MELNGIPCDCTDWTVDKMRFDWIIKDSILDMLGFGWAFKVIKIE